MRNQTEPSPDLPTFSFSTILYGLEASIAVVWNKQYSDVLLNGELVAQLKFEENVHAWFVAAGELNDYDLVKEIGTRIEAKYY